MKSILVSRHAWGLLVPVLVLCGISLLTMQALFSPEPTRVPASAAVKQLGFMGVGLVLAWLAAAVGYQRLGRWAYLLFVVCLLILAALRLDTRVDLPFIPERNGARRWIEIGSIQLQPSELMKIAYVLALAWYLKYRRNYRTFAGLAAPFFLTLVPMGLIIIQPDLGTVLLFLPVLFAMLFAAGAKVRHLLIIILLGAMCLPLFWLHIRDYQRLRLVGMVLQTQRLRTYFDANPDKWQWFRPPKTTAAEWRSELRQWEDQAGYQLVHGKAAIGSGGVLGAGWANGPFIENEFLLPERENDFVFAIVANQWGLVGALIVLCCYAAIVVMGLDVATVTKDPFGRLVAVGLTTLIAFQALTNLCMTVGIGPITGITLPFVSKGGSSLVASFVCVGLLVSVARDRPIIMAKAAFEFDEEAERYSHPA
ncbi:MAG: rod shape-determining protein RodA [Planctomycetes bacterium]|nr:rod shape-determining protein RodA [Planctomycetota bacterium]